MRKIYSKKMKTTVLVLALVFALIAGVGTGIVNQTQDYFTFREAVKKVEYNYSIRSLDDVYSRGYDEMTGDMLADRLGDGDAVIDITDIYGSQRTKSTSYSSQDLKDYASSDDARALGGLLDQLDNGSGSYSIWGDGYELDGYFYRTDDGRILFSDEYIENIEDAADGTELSVVKNMKGDLEDYKLSDGRKGKLHEISGVEACASLMDLPEGTDVSKISEEFIFLYKYGRNYETISTVNGSKLWNYALKDPARISLADLYRELIYASDQVEAAYGADKNSDPMPPVYYYAKDRKTGEVFTNRPSWRKSELKALLEELEVPFVAIGYYGGSSPYSKALGISDKSLISEWNSYGVTGMDEQGAVIGDKDVIYAMSDTEPMPAPEEADKLTPWFIPALAALALGFLGALVMLILAVIQAGRREEDREIVPSKYAMRCPVEIMLVIDAAAWGVVVASAYTIGVNILVTDMWTSVKMLLLGALFTAAVAAALLTLVPLASKIKGKAVAENSLLRKLFKAVTGGIRRVYRGCRPTARAVIVIVCVLLVSFVSVILDAYIVTAVLWAAVIVLLMRKAIQKNILMEGIKKVAGGDLDFRIDTSRMSGDELEMAEAVNRVKDSMRTAVDLQMKSERMKTDLITNVSHDIKTPLTSIISYVDLIKREDIEDDKIREYVDVLDAKAHRLKQLTDDLVEVSKTSSGSIELEVSRIDLKELIMQTQGEFYKRFTDRDLTIISNMPEEGMVIDADGKRVYRILENLYSNAAKYSMPGSRVYAEGTVEDHKVKFTLRNMSENELNISADELMERFVRGDVSRNTEGSGLGLEIARNLTVLMMGDLDISIDGDLFKVTVSFPQAE